MAQIHHYAHATTPAGPGSDTVITDVLVDPGNRFTAAAAVGDASVVAITVEDPDGVYDIKGLWRWYVIEDACDAADHYAWNGYVGTQSISRGDGSDLLYPVAAGRRWELELSELSALAGFRVIAEDDGNRPEETITARLTWLIGTATAYLPVFDNGLITWDTTTLDPNDYRGQYASDILNDMALVVGFNWWIYYDQAASDPLSLAFFDPESSLYASTLAISNVAASINGTSVFAPGEDSRLERDPGKIAAGVYLPYSGSAIYAYDYATAYEFAFRDQVAPTASIKTAAAAAPLAQRFLADNSEQDERAFIPVRLPAAQLNGIKHGQRIDVTMTHWPGWEDGKACRVVRKSFGVPDNRDQTHYAVDLELSPIRAQPGLQQAYDFYQSGDSVRATPTLLENTTPGNILLALVIQLGSTVDTGPAEPTFMAAAPGTAVQTWTKVVYESAKYTSQWPGPGHSIGLGWYYRTVAVAEETTTPVQVVGAVPLTKTGVWLWEMDPDATPTSYTSYSTGHGSTNIANGGTATIGTALTGYVLAAMAIQIVDYGLGPDVTNLNGTERANYGNDHSTSTAARASMPPWVLITTFDSGGVQAAKLVSRLIGPNYYNGFGVVGAAVTLPTITSLDIP